MNTEVNANPKGEGQLRDLELGESIILNILKTLFPTTVVKCCGQTPNNGCNTIVSDAQTANLHSGDYCAVGRSLDVTALKNVPVEMLRRHMCKWRTRHSNPHSRRKVTKP